MKLNKKVVILAAVCAAIFVSAAAVCFFLFSRPCGRLVRITSAGETVAVIDLASAENYTFEVTCAEGVNKIKIEDGTICVSEADCPDKTCVKMGRLGGGMPIVCLPHRLVIEFISSDTDAVAG